MMCRTSIFALLATAMTFAAEGVNYYNVQVAVDSHIGSVSLTPTLGPFTRGQTVTQSMGFDTDFTASASNVDSGYTAYWKVVTNNVLAIGPREVNATNKINIPSTPTKPHTATPVYSDCTLSFSGEPNTYNVTLDRQPVSGGSSSVTATYDAAMPSATMPTRTGYTFGGYYINTNDVATQYYTASGASTRTWNIASNVTLHAKWTANTYTVTLDPLPGSGGTASVTATYGSDMPAITPPTQDGYMFGGYYTETNRNDTQYYTAGGASARTWDIATNKTLYAKWVEAAFTVTFDPQGGSGGTESVTATYGRALPSITKPARGGYKFNGYYEEVNGGGTQYYTLSGASLANSPFTSNTTIYAYWTQNPTVTFERNGGEFKSGSVWTTVTNYEEGVGLPSLPTGSDIIYANHAFAGWYEHGSTKEVTSIGPTATGDKTLSAKWVGESYWVTFDANDASGKSGEQELQMANPETLTPVSELFSREGYSFDAWNTRSDGFGESYADQAQITPANSLTNVSNARVTLYAQWTPNQYEVVFQPNGADGGETMPNQVFTYDVTQRLDTVEFTYTGHAFKEWTATNDNNQTMYYTDGAAVANLAPGGEVNLYANWTGVVYTVSFDANGGEEDPEHPMAPITCTYNVPTNLPFCTFYRDGWGFKGWTNNLAEGVSFADHARVTNLTTRAEEVQMYACWTGSTYAVVFDTQGDGVMTIGEGEEVSVWTNSYVVGDAWEDLPVPTNVDTQHWDFAGWAYVDAQGEKKAIPAEVPPPSTGTTNLVATWSWKVDELAAAVDAPKLKFSTFGTAGGRGVPTEPSANYTWFAQADFVYGSTSAVQSAELPVNTANSDVYVSWLTTTVETNGVLSFWWKCDAPPMEEESGQQYELRPGWCGNSFTFGLYDSAKGITNTIAQLTDHADWCCVVYTNNSDSSVTFAWAFAYADYDANNGGGTGWVDRVTWKPDGSPTAEVTSPHKVSYSWLRTTFPEHASDTDAALEDLAESQSPGAGLPPGKTWPDGTPVMVWQDYWAGTNPNDPDDLFRADITVSNDVPYISWQPDLRTNDPSRVYQVLCAPTPSASAQEWVEWPGPGDSGASTHRFFKVKLVLEEE